MVGRAAKKILRSAAFSNRKMASPRRHPYRLSAHSGVRKPDLLPSLLRTLSEWRLKRSAGLRPSASRFVPKLVDSAKTAEPKMAFNFAHLLSAACGGAPHRLRRLRRPCALGALSARPCCGFWASWGAGSARFVPDFDVSGKTAEPKMAFNFAHLLSAACGGAPRRLGRLRRPPGSGSSVYGCGCARYTKPALYGVLRGSTTTQSWLPHAREWLLYLRKHWASLVPHP